jgi:hypothetical protein
VLYTAGVAGWPPPRSTPLLLKVLRVRTREAGAVEVDRGSFHSFTIMNNPTGATHAPSMCMGGGPSNVRLWAAWVGHCRRAGGAIDCLHHKGLRGCRFGPPLLCTKSVALPMLVRGCLPHRVLFLFHSQLFSPETFARHPSPHVGGLAPMTACLFYVSSISSIQVGPVSQWCDVPVTLVRAA